MAASGAGSDQSGYNPLNTLKMIGPYRNKDQFLRSERKVNDWEKVNKMGINPTRLGLCCFNGTKLIRSHGSIFGLPFKIPKGVNVITLANVGHPVTLDTFIDESIREFYSSGNHFFKYKDKGTTLTNAGKDFQNMIINYLNEMYKDEIPDLEIRNHVGPAKINNMILKLGEGCGD